MRTYARGLGGVVSLVAALLAPTHVARAQSYAQLGDGTHTAFLLGIGVSFPAGAIASRVDPTENVMLGFQVRQGHTPVAFRMDLTFQEFSGPDGWASINALTFDAVALPEHNGATQWHAIFGLGPYYTTGSAFSGIYSGYRSSTVFGINGGGGISHGKKVAVFAEVRYHLLFQGGRVLQMIPLTFGISLRAS
jgi:hypothetical protein